MLFDHTRAILKAREPFYRQAETRLDTSSKTVTQSLRDLLKLLQKQPLNWLNRSTE